MRRWLLGASVVAAGCGGASPANETRIPVWEVARTPSLTIGENEQPGFDLAGVTGARRAGGAIVVANSGSGELLHFDSTGKFLGTAGRKGQGPGEFGASIYLFPAPGDSLYTFDAGNLRWSMHDSAGKFERVLAGGDRALPRPAWLHHGMVVESNGPDPIPGWAVRLLNGLTASASHHGIRVGRFDDLGYLWLRDSLAGSSWKVYADSGAAIAQVSVPAQLRITQIGPDFVLGIGQDSLDRDVILAFRLMRSKGTAGPAEGVSAELPRSDSAAVAALLSNLSQVLVSQEMFYSNHGAYTADRDSLGASIAAGAQLMLLSGDKRHWAGVLYDPAHLVTCGVSVGFPAPPGWVDGTVFCGR